MADRVARTLSLDGTVRGLAAVTTGLVEEARVRHGTLPTATAALGRALTAALLLAGTLKADERLSLEFSGDGPLRGILAEANPDGDARGFVFRPRTHLPARAGKLDVGGALGAGVLCVIRVPLVEGVRTENTTVHYSVSDTGTLIYLPGAYSGGLGQQEPAADDLLGHV